MRIRLRYVLPGAQILVAVGLYRWSDLWLAAQMSHGGTTPGFTLLTSLNGPISMVRAYYTRHLSEVWDRTVFILAIGVLWYWVAVNVEHLSLNRPVVTFSWAPLRVIADLLLMALVGLMAMTEFDCRWWWVPRMDVPDPQWLWRSCSLSCFLAWSFILLIFSVRDLVLLARRPGRQCGGPVA